MTLVLLVALVAGEIALNNELIPDYSAVIPLTLETEMMRIACNPPEGTKANEILCDIGVTNTVLTNKRGVSEGDSPTTVVYSN
jgi:hypothetical protein